jgi:hypothetical protein
MHDMPWRPVRSNGVERAIAGWLMRGLARRGWLVHMNQPDECSNIREDARGRYDIGWRPLFSIRYGKTPVYRISTERWVHNGFTNNVLIVGDSLSEGYGVTDDTGGDAPRDAFGEGPQ